MRHEDFARQEQPTNWAPYFSAPRRSARRAGRVRAPVPRDGAPNLACENQSMRPKLKKWIGRWLVGISLLLPVGVIWFCFLGGGYHAEFWLARFDRSAWVENRTKGLHSPRRSMIKSLMRHLKPGMSRKEVEGFIGKPDRENAGWQTYMIGFPRWDAFYFDPDVFEVLYEDGRLAGMRVRNT